MRRVILLALLALALPTVALADSVDFNINGGTMTVGSSSVTISTNVTGVSFCNPNCGSVTPTTGSATLTLPSFATNSNASFATGGNVSLSGGGYVFSGTFTSGSWTVNTVGKQKEYQFSGMAAGTLTFNGHSVQTTMTFVNGQSTLGGCPRGVCSFASGNVTASGVVPEPGTLGLLGTGLIGLAGLVRRKIRG